MTSAQLVPPNATFLERVMDDLASRISDVPADVISTIWNPETCPPDALPFLAWALSVDFWNPEWTEQTKREVVASSYQVHATKGTVGALKRALGPLGMRIALREWWEHDGEPHTFGLTATVLPGAPATEGVQRDLVRIIDATKPARSHLTDLRMAAEFGQNLNMGGVGQATNVQDRGGRADGRNGLDGQVRLVTSLATVQQHDSAGQVDGRRRLHGDATISSVLSVETRTDGSGPVRGRNTLLGEAAAGFAVIGVASRDVSGPADGRREFEVDGPLVGAVAASQSAEYAMPNEDDMGQRIILSGASFQEVTITAVNGALVMIQGGKTTYITGRPPQPDIQMIGLATGVAGASTFTFSGPAGLIEIGETLIISAALYKATAVGGATITINPPLEADLDGFSVMRLRMGE